jgi:hypothetical protein
MVTRRGIRLADDGLKRLRWRIIDVVDVVCNAPAGCPRGATAPVNAAANDCHSIIVFRRNLRDGDDDHHRRRG